VVAALLTVRRATADDVRFVYEVNNDPVARAQSLNTAPIPWERHVAWFEQKVADPQALMFIGCRGETPVGVVRFEAHPDGSLLSFALLAAERGQGLAAPLLEAGTRAAFEHGVQRVIAFVRPSNQPSAKAFHRAHYELVGREREGDLEVLRFERRRAAGGP
jgi:UDP-2,4-diacetamido-2,4,6-trideoxy-beta-L-altropyranose hydrolase